MFSALAADFITYKHCIYYYLIISIIRSKHNLTKSYSLLE